jgi:uncharacterized membrane protein
MSGSSRETLSSSSEKSMAGLIVDILNDGQTLLLQEIQLAKHEIQDEVRKTVAAALSLAIGGAIALFAGLVLVLMLVHLLNAVTELPLWACYATVGLILSAITAALISIAAKKLKDIHLVPVRTVETLKENVQWFKEIATSRKI